MADLSWNALRAFLAAAETQSFSGASRRLGLTQPTVSRQIAALETALGITLFERTGKTLLLTASGHRLLPHAQLMGVSADRFELVAAGQAESASGLVSISASDGIAVHMLPPVIRKLATVAPAIQIEIVTSNTLSDLRRREADIAIRHVRPEDPELFARLLRQATARFYASEDWVKRNGLPQTAEDAAGKDFIGFNRTDEMAERLRPLGIDLRQANFSVMSENSMTAWALVRAGMGIGIMMQDIADQCSDVVPVLTELPDFEFPIWLVTHREVKTNRAIRTVFGVLAECLCSPPATASAG